FLSKVCLGIELPEEPFLPQRNRFFFGFYTVAAAVYRWVVLLSILWFLYKVFEPHGLKVVGQTLATVAVFGMIGMPIWKAIKFLRVPGRMNQVKRPNLYGTVGVVAAVVLVIL